MAERPGGRGLSVGSACDLTAFLTSRGFTRTRVKRLLRHGAIEVNGRPATRGDLRLSPGDTVLVGRKPPEPEAVAPRGIDLVYEDDSLIVVSKPAGLLAIATEHEKRRTAYRLIGDFLKKRAPRAQGKVFVVHRLDRETSGLMVFAKSEEVKRALQEKWSSAEKRYYAVVEGVPGRAEGVVRSHLSQTGSLTVYSGRPTARSKPSVTRYRVLKAGRGRALLDVSLDTGRKHQIRVHLSDIDHPVAGDRKYGAETDPLRRLALHAYLLAFDHPVTGRRLRFETPPPRGFTEIVGGGRGRKPKGRGPAPAP